MTGGSLPNQMMTDQWSAVSIVYAEKRWGHGRLRQLLRRMWCRHFDSHEWGETNWEGEVGIARCTNECGGQVWQRRTYWNG